MPVVIVGDIAPALTTDGNAVTVVGRRESHLGPTTTQIAGFTSPGWLLAAWLV